VLKARQVGYRQHRGFDRSQNQRRPTQVTPPRHREVQSRAHLPDAEPLQTTTEFTSGRPWLLHFFDQIRFYPVSNAELTQFREDFPQGKAKLSIEEATLRLRDYRKFLVQHTDEITAFKNHQQAFFEAEQESMNKQSPRTARQYPLRFQAASGK
jgi:hypothetical protein